jgi:hypothetical protein
MAYRNDTQGARAIHLTNGTHVLLEPGAVLSINPAKVRRVAPGIVQGDDPDTPPIPKDLAKKVKKTDNVKALREEYKKKLGKNAFGGWDAATLREKIAAASK